MPERNAQHEIRRVRSMLLKMVELAEHAEQTGSFENGVRNTLRRYNAIVEHLEENNRIPEDLFPTLDDDETDFGQLGAEASALADYLSEEAEAALPPPGRREHHIELDLGPLVALAPFLGSEELSKLVRERLGRNKAPAAPEPPVAPASPADPMAPASPASPSASAGPDLQTIIGLAPHVDRGTLGEMVRACLSRQKLADPGLLVALAPHMDKAEFSQIIREQLPGWFGGQANTSNSPDIASQEQAAGGGIQTAPTDHVEAGTESWPSSTPPPLPNELR